MADAQVSEACGGDPVRVQVSLSALSTLSFYLAKLCRMSQNYLARSAIEFWLML